MKSLILKFKTFKTVEDVEVEKEKLEEYKVQRSALGRFCCLVTT